MPKRGRLWRSIVKALLVLVGLMLLALALYTAWTHGWRVRQDVPKLTFTAEHQPVKDDPGGRCDQTQFTLARFHSGDILLVFGQGHDTVWATGHMAIVVKLPQHGQLYVWDVPNPLFYPRADVLKPLSSYVKSALKPSVMNFGMKPRIYVAHLRAEANGSEAAHDALTRQLLPLVHRLASTARFDGEMMRTHLKFCVRTTLTAKTQQATAKSPENRLRASHTTITSRRRRLAQITDQKRKKQLHTCTSSVLGLLVTCGVLKEDILVHIPCYQEGEWVGDNGGNLYPHMFLHPNFEFQKHFANGWTYAPPVELVLPRRKAGAKGRSDAV